MKIGLTFTGWGEKHQNYVKWLKGRDKDVEVIKLTAGDDPNMILQCDALVLSGGIDIDPDLYNGSRDYSGQPKKWDRKRDEFERTVFGHAMQNDLPVLGVCRGLQLINVLLHGTLIQDLGQGDERHESVGNIDRAHPVTVESGSLLFEIAGNGRGEANSAHHQAIGRLGEGLKINSRADDGTIEGIEWEAKEGKPFMLAVQWHPERMYTNKFADKFLFAAIRDRFVAEVKSSASRHLVKSKEHT